MSRAGPWLFLMLAAGTLTVELGDRSRGGYCAWMEQCIFKNQGTNQQGHKHEPEKKSDSKQNPRDDTQEMSYFGFKFPK
jgi:hypothetical protein